MLAYPCDQLPSIVPIDPEQPAAFYRRRRVVRRGDERINTFFMVFELPYTYCISDIISLVASSCEYYRGEIEQRAAQ
jgi:hypothetical protein